jgi:hypothetical protein
MTIGVFVEPVLAALDTLCFSPHVPFDLVCGWHMH